MSNSSNPGTVYLVDDSIAQALDAAKLKDAKVVTYSYYASGDQNIYSPSSRANPLRLTSGSLPGPLGARTPGFYFMWKPGE